MRTAHVSLGSRSYEIVVGSGLMGSAFEHLTGVPGLRGFQKAVIVTDINVDPLYGEVLSKQAETVASVERLVIQAGEKSKSWTVAGRLLEDLAALGVGRHDLLVTLGGGVISDLGGFAASTYLRGIHVVHIPTTLLGQVDAAIGGKTGVNLSAGKNLAGSFYQPSAVICDVETLPTLPEREFRSGLAEVIKYGLCFDSDILALVEGRLSTAASSDPGSDEDKGPGHKGAETRDFWDHSIWEEIVFRCAAIKGGVVSTDETDQSARMLLNYGHTLGHALEAAGGFSKWSHGEAISVGMVFAANLARNLGILDGSVVALHRKIFEAAGLPVAAHVDHDEIMRFCRMDKKWDHRQRWVLLEGLGKPVIRSDVEAPAIEAAMKSITA